LTDHDVIQLPDNQKPREPWTFIPNMDENCLEFIEEEDEPELSAELEEELFPVNVEQGRDLQFITISGSPSLDDERDV